MYSTTMVLLVFIVNYFPGKDMLSNTPESWFAFAFSVCPFAQTVDFDAKTRFFLFFLYFLNERTTLAPLREVI